MRASLLLLLLLLLRLSTMSLGDKFAQCKKAFIAIEQSELGTADKALQQRISETLDGFQELEQGVDVAGVFSKNEELDDVHTGDLKFLLIPYYIRCQGISCPHFCTGVFAPCTPLAITHPLQSPPPPRETITFKLF